LCSAECRIARSKQRSTKIETRHKILLRILDREEVWRDPLRNPAVLQKLLLQGCKYCHASLIEKSGICIDRLSEKHTFETVVPCCGTCNRIKSSGPGKYDGFTFTEMVEQIGPAVREVRKLRKKANGGKNGGKSGRNKIE